MPTASLPGIYSGRFPCDGCAGIAVALWLRNDRVYFFHQQYAATDERAAMEVVSLGRWQPAEDGYAVRLVGKGPTRTLTRAGDTVLNMRTGSPLPHQLVRDPALSQLDVAVRMQGRMRLRDSVAVFTECQSGLSATVSTSGDYRRFRHQLRGMDAKGGDVPVELTGRFDWAADGSPQQLTISQFVSIQPEQEC